MAKHDLKSSPGLRLLIIGVLSLILLIPSIMIQALIREREQRRASAIFEVCEKWGKNQTISGPILTLPYNKTYKDNEDKIQTSIAYAHFLPDLLNIDGKINPNIRYRGIFEVILYNTKINISGNFSYPDLAGLSIAEKDILWQDAFISVGISDLKGIRDVIKIKWNNSELIASPGVETNDVLSSSISSNTSLYPEINNYSFSLELNLNGSEQLQFTPLGKKTLVKLSSNWDTPSFVGEFLPESRNIQENSFSADWRILHLNRNYTQKWSGARFKIYNSSFGVKLLLAVDEYQKTMRTAKYAIMFIGLTFLSFFMIEILNRKVIHPIQYLLIGLALIIFYTLLLSISEHILFQYAYIIASLSMILLITGYSKSVLKNNILTLIIGGILVILYGFLYTILQLQDYALLIGSLGLFVILAIIMFLTRKIDWFTVFKPGDNVEELAK